LRLVELKFGSFCRVQMSPTAVPARPRPIAGTQVYHVTDSEVRRVSIKGGTPEPLPGGAVPNTFNNPSLALSPER
jgi:hypothetical protein